MTVEIREQLSALIDGELDAVQARFLLKRIQNDPELAAQYARMQLSAQCLRRQPWIPAPAGFSAAVAARIQGEPATARMPGWLRPAMGMAVAAGVAALALFVSLPTPRDESTQAGTTPSLAQDTGLRTSDLVAPLNVQRASSVDRFASAPTPLDPVIEDYLLRHGAASAERASVGYMPYVYVVATPPAQGAGFSPAVVTQPNP